MSNEQEFKRYLQEEGIEYYIEGQNLCIPIDNYKGFLNLENQVTWDLLDLAEELYAKVTITEDDIVVRF